MMSAVEKQKLETIRYLADSQTPPFVLPAEPSDFGADCPPPSPTLSKFLKTVPPRPGQAIQKSADVRHALGPRDRCGSGAAQQQDVLAVRNERETSITKRREDMENVAAEEASKVRMVFHSCVCKSANAYWKCHRMILLILA
jgi:hypothetical protein